MKLLYVFLKGIKKSKILFRVKAEIKKIINETF